MRAARAWASGELAGDDDTDDALADARRDGWPEEEIEALRIELGRSAFKLWGMHLMAWRAFTAGATQWRTRLVASEVGLVDRVMGLDYAGLKVALDVLDIALLPHQWVQLAVLERAAAAAMNGEASR